VAIAGTATTLCALHLGLPAYDGGRVHRARLTLQDVRALAERLAAMPLGERLALPGLQPKRADVIVAGAELLAAAMERLGVEDVTISDKGVRWGLLYRRFAA
jgi:exopolyphosphatase/guanosine-5'-triphosphate,3'-diphosphate pyrophosphatase